MHQINWLLKSEEWLLVCWCVSTAPQCCLYVVVLWLYFIYITTFLLLLPWFCFCIWPNCNFDIISVNCSAPLCVIAAMYLRRRREEFIMVCVVCVVCVVCRVCVVCVVCVSCVCRVCRVCCVSCCLLFQVSRNLFLNVLWVLNLFIVFDQYFTKLACSVFWHLFIILYLLNLHHVYYYVVSFIIVQSNQHHIMFELDFSVTGAPVIINILLELSFDDW